MIFKKRVGVKLLILRIFKGCCGLNWRFGDFRSGGF